MIDLDKSYERPLPVEQPYDDNNSIKFNIYSEKMSSLHGHERRTLSPGKSEVSDGILVASQRFFSQVGSKANFLLNNMQPIEEDPFKKVATSEENHSDDAMGYTPDKSPNKTMIEIDTHPINFEVSHKVLKMRGGAVEQSVGDISPPDEREEEEENYEFIKNVNEEYFEVVS